MYARELFEEGGCTNTERLTQLLCGPKSGSILDRIYDRFSSRPHTLLHGDLRADNIFRTDPARGLSVEDSQLIYIDWQLMSVGPPGPELTQAWIHSVRPEVRRMDKKLLRQYHERLVSLQPEAKAYSFEMLVEDYILGLSVWWAALVTIGANTLPDFDQPESARMKRLWEISIPRTLIALEDHDCLAAIETIAAS
jgi:thiamine kinase-like enzyme